MGLEKRSRSKLWAPLVLGLSSLAALFPPVVHGSQAQELGAERPNILIIVTDDQRSHGTLAVMPRTKEFFQDRGVSFTNAVATTPLCCPSRTSILTGLYAHNHNVRENSATATANFNPQLSLQRYLDQAGYQTGLFGKFLNHWDLSQNPEYFDRWSVFNYGYWKSQFNVDGVQQTVYQYSTDFVASQARAFLEGTETADDAPWFMYVAPFAPHLPARPKPLYKSAAVPELERNPATFEQDLSDKPPYVANRQEPIADIERRRAKQLRTLMSVEDLIADVAETMNVHNEASETLAFFMSDNGFLWGEHGLWAKGVPYTDSTEIPVLMRWPGHVASGTVDDRLAANIDIAPTVLDAAGLAPSPPMDGRSLLGGDERERVLLEMFGSKRYGGLQWSSTRSEAGGYQYVENYDPETGARFVEYYDLGADPFQLTNLLADGFPLNDPDTAPLSAQLLQDMHCSAGSCP